MNTVFRVRYVFHRGTASGGEVALYEDHDSMRRDLLDAYLGTAAVNRSLASREVSWLMRSWRKFIRQEPEYNYNYREIRKVEQLVDNEWGEIQVEFVEPQVVLLGVRS